MSSSPGSSALVIQRPEGPPGQLILLFHGVGATPEDLRPLGERLAAQFHAAFVVSVPGSEACDFGAGRQWFSVRGIDEDNRAARIDAAMPAFVAAVRHWQREAGVGAEPTALIGFSQGAIMALASTQRGEPTLAGRVVGISGRFARLPEQAAADTTFHLLHGKHDTVVPYVHTVQAAERLVAIGADVTADVIPFVGHQIDAEMEDTLLERLLGYVPRRTWEAAMRAQPSGD